MGNCQGRDAATLVVQHPSGKVDTFHLPVSASEVMRMNPGHYVARLLSTTLYPFDTKGDSPDKATTSNTAAAAAKGSVKLTRIKLLRSTDTLALGHVYRLVTTQEVMKGLLAKKQAKLKKNKAVPAERLDTESRSELGKDNQETENEMNRTRTTASSNSASARSKTWQPSLESISEAVS